MLIDFDQKALANIRPELLITSYFNIVKRTMIDMVPKAVMYTLVQYVLNLFDPLIFTELTTSQIFQGLDAVGAAGEHVPQRAAA